MVSYIDCYVKVFLLYVISLGMVIVAMATKITIKRDELKRIRQMIKSIGGYISGRLHDEYGIGRTFWNTLTVHLFQKIYEAYVVKSHGGTDELGNTWAPLKESTVNQKIKPTKSLRSARSKESSLRGLKKPKDTRRLIMRETDRLITSLKPSIIRGSSGYSPRNEQIVYSTVSSFVIGTEVPYAKYHNSSRPVIPENAGVWVSEAINAAVESAKSRMIEVLK